MKKRKIFRFLFSLLTAAVFFSCLVTEDDVIEKSSTTKEETFSDEYKIPVDFDFEGTVAPWYHFSQAAASVTFDDGTYDQYAAAFPLLEELDIKGSFYLAARLIDQGSWDDNGKRRKMMSWIEAAEIAAAGHEIGSHSMNHRDMTEEGVNLKEELLGSRKFIEEKLPGVKIETFCWPHWRETPETIEIASSYYLSARSGNGIIDYYLNRKGGIPENSPLSMYAINALGFLDSHREEEWKVLIDRVYEKGSWFVSSYHGVNNGTLSDEELGWNPLKKDMFIQTLEYQKEKAFWIDTFANVSKYIYERDASVLYIGNKGFKIELTLDDQLDDTIYNQKISVSLKKPENWSAPVLRDSSGQVFPYTMSHDRIFLDIFPDGSSFELKPY